MKTEMKAEIVAALQREPEHAESLITLLAVTHRLERIEAWADGTLTLERGRLVEQPTVPLPSPPPHPTVPAAHQPQPAAP